MRTCKQCGESRPLEQFAWVNETRGWRRKTCRDCRRRDVSSEERAAYHLKSRYGLSVDDYSEMLNKQNGGCAICGTTKPGGRYDKLHVDHCHETGKVRGLLCHNCNRALGLLGDNISTLTNAINYLNGPLNS